MRVANITLHAINNYGSVLQTYATEQIFLMLGCQVVTIDYVRKTARMGIWDIIKDDKMPISLKFKSLIYRALFHNKVRDNIFEEFKNKYLTLSKRYYSNDELKSDIPQADIYCTGSDQTWNTVCQGGVPKAFFLDFVPKDKLRISYASSFGVKELPEDDKKLVEGFLKKYSAISVREMSGVDIIKRMGLNATLVLDPTLAVPAKVWYDLSAPRMFDEDYLLAYQLNRSNKFTKYMHDFAKAKGLRLILVRARKERVKNGECITTATPQEWLSLIRHAKCVLTDSFHCTAYCILFHKQFVNILPPNFSDRVVNILKETGLENRIVSKYNDFSVCDSPIDFAPIDSWLDSQREKTLVYLQSALDSTKQNEY